jgi:uncharacterized protein (TIGR02145 family)
MVKTNIMIRQRFFSFVVVSLILLGCAQKGGDEPKADAELSSDGQSVTIGKQVWMTQNLDVSTFRNGDPIPEAKTEGDWKAYNQAGEPAWCYYNNDPTNGVKYGKLCNWYAVSDTRGLPPKGWHIPSDQEWTVLVDYLGGQEKAGAKMKSKDGWIENGNGTNSSGFSGLPGGFRSDDGIFFAIGSSVSWWSSTEDHTNDAWLRSLSYLNGTVNRTNYVKGLGLSIRCLRD